MLFEDLSGQGNSRHTGEGRYPVPWIPAKNMPE
jgi:hypothetical protein